MKELKDSEIKLFGKNIAFPDNGRVVPPAKVAAGEGGGNDENSSGFDLARCLREEKVSKVGEEAKELEKDEDEQEKNKDCLAGEVCESGDHNALSEENNNSEAIPINEDSTIQEPSKDEKDETDTTDSDQKTLKKPDKILPCPRCNSMDTKFCYYNNYNVNQPRHFCKRCQRYWTAGGSMRNVPVGAGRRKNKNSASHCHHIMVSEALQASQVDALNGYHHPELKSNGTFLSFGASPRYDSMASVAERNTPNGTRNGRYKQENGVSIPCKGGENGDDCSSGSSGTTMNSMGNGGQNQPQEPVIQNINGFHTGFQSPIPCLPGVPWPFPWNGSVPMPGVSPSGYPMPFYPVPYWNYNVPGPWSIPWMSPTPFTATQNPSGSDTISPTLGKRSRDGELLNPSTPESKESSERSILIPKTLRIDDPEEAAKSSIWATLGIKYDSADKRGSMFNAFQPKYAKKKDAATTSPLLQANPAALSRSFSFQESAK